LSTAGDHGRIDVRKAAVAPITPVTAGLPGARSAITAAREWFEKKEPQNPKSHTRFFLSSLAVEEKKRSTKDVRNHWRVENSNHFKRDTSLWQEDQHRHRSPKAALNLALTRNALLAIIPFDKESPRSHFFELYHRSPAKALNLILQSRPAL
jgi:predicted transposase YbfD/YdcC